MGCSRAARAALPVNGPAMGHTFANGHHAHNGPGRNGTCCTRGSNTRIMSRAPSTYVWRAAFINRASSLAATCVRCSTYTSRAPVICTPICSYRCAYRRNWFACVRAPSAYWGTRPVFQSTTTPVASR